LSKTRLHPRHLDWEGVLNARDSGGLRTPEGQIRQGALVRSGLLSDLTPAGMAALTEHGVRTVVDVRGANEVAESWQRYPIKGDGTVGYMNLPFRAGLDSEELERVRAAWNTAQSRQEFNRADLDFHRPGITAIISAIADAPPGGVLVHCHAGKDRTGIVVALALAVVGVSDDEIAEDYALSELAMEQIMVEWLAHIGAAESEHERHWALAMPSREAMLDTLAYLRERYGGAERYLLDGGMTREHLSRLRARLVAANTGEAE
jgi:protein tyrosine/serine phosphatase